MTITLEMALYYSFLYFFSTHLPYIIHGSNYQNDTLDSKVIVSSYQKVNQHPQFKNKLENKFVPLATYAFFF